MIVLFSRAKLDEGKMFVDTFLKISFLSFLLALKANETKEINRFTHIHSSHVSV